MVELPSKRWPTADPEATAEHRPPAMTDIERSAITLGMADHGLADPLTRPTSDAARVRIRVSDPPGHGRVSAHFALQQPSDGRTPRRHDTGPRDLTGRPSAMTATRPSATLVPRPARGTSQ